MIAADNPRESIKQFALEKGFDVVRFTGATLPSEIGKQLKLFLSQDRHGTMEWMEARAEQRASPHTLWSDARSAIVLAMNYGPSHDPLTVLSEKDNAAISVYAQNNDYHDIIKKRMKVIGRWMASTFECELKVFVDTAPLMEKPLAAQAGIGWQGKHTNLVSRDHGSWLFLGAILTTLELTPDQPEDNHCGSCQQCLDVCPTDAFPAPYQLDARRCISYLTIEHKDPIPVAFRSKMGNRIYGCDDCLAVCPWNKFAQTAQEQAFHAREELKAPPLTTLAALDDQQFRQLFSKSPVKRIGRERFIRNVAIALGNSADADTMDSIKPLLRDESAVVRGAAVWAARQLLSNEQLNALKTEHATNENDLDVLSEWQW